MDKNIIEFRDYAKKQTTALSIHAYETGDGGLSYPDGLMLSVSSDEELRDNWWGRWQYLNALEVEALYNVLGEWLEDNKEALDEAKQAAARLAAFVEKQRGLTD